MSDRLNLVQSIPTGDLDLLADLVSASHQGTMSAHGWYAGRWAMRFEATNDRGFHIVAAGTVDVRLDDGTTVRLHEGDIVLVGAPHVLASDLSKKPRSFSPEAVAALEVEPEDADTCLICGAYTLERPDTHPVFSNLPPLIVLRAGERDPSVDAMVKVLDAEFRGRPPGASAVAARLIDTMLIYILRHWIDSDCPRAAGWLRALRDPVLARALALIQHHYAQPWTLAELARASGTSRASLARHFTAEVGTPPMQFLADRRLGVASELVQASSLSLEEVAQRVGYGSAFSLSKAFKRKYGEAPRHHHGVGQGALASAAQ